MKKSLWIFVLAMSVSGVALADPLVYLHTANVGIGSLTVIYDAVSLPFPTITLEEDWTSVAPGLIVLENLDLDQIYLVRKIITNNTGEEWNRLANEVLDPAGDANDASDVGPYPPFVPAGWTTSNDADGWSFAQADPGPRTSTTFGSITVDELTDSRDFLDFYGGTLTDGAVDTMVYRISRVAPGLSGVPVMLSQRPNAFSVPEPASALLLALCGVLMMRRR